MLLNNQQITEEIKKEIKICIEIDENENTTTQNLWDSVEAVLRERSIEIQAYLKKQEKHQINNLTVHLKQLEKEEKKNLKVSRKKEFIKIRQERNEGVYSKDQPILKQFFQKINKIDKPLTRLIKKKGRIIKSIKLEMKMEKSQQTTQKYKRSYKTTMSKYMPIKWTTWRKWTNA